MLGTCRLSTSKNRLSKYMYRVVCPIWCFLAFQLYHSLNIVKINGSAYLVS